MSLSQWLLVFLIVQLIHFGGTWKLYLKAGYKAWQAAVPGYNAVILMRIIKRPWWWVLLLLIPVINLLMFPIIWVETLRSFGRMSRWEAVLVTLSLGFYLYYVNYTLDVKHRPDRETGPRSTLGEWVSSILFAVVAATLVHTYVMRPFIIPSSSLEKTLLVGDFLFVSKFHYGARTPITPIAAPMVHDTVPGVPVPFTGAKLTKQFKSYLKWPELPYFRFPGFQKIKQNDIVVFNWPADTVRQFFVPEPAHYKPIDKRSNYVKRCVGLPGDSLSIRDGYVFINGNRNTLPGRAKTQYNFLIYSNKGVSTRLLHKMGARELGFSYSARYSNPRQLEILQRISSGVRTNGDKVYFSYPTRLKSSFFNQLGLQSPREVAGKVRMATLTEAEAERLEAEDKIDSVVREKVPKTIEGSRLFPKHPLFNWSEDNFGPIYLPKAGDRVELSAINIPLYKKAIRDYEGNEVKVKGSKIWINNKESDSYTFKDDYYWMMGDNRHRSEDSRFWGMVPFKAVVGKPVFIWFSWETRAQGIMNKIRWERLFTTVGGEDKPVSYFKYFVILLVGWFIFSFIRNRRKKPSEK